MAEWGLLLTAIGLALLATPDDSRLLPILGLLIGSSGVRWARIGRIAAKTPLTLPIALWAVSVLIAWWVAPLQGAATMRLAWATAAVALFYGLVSSDGATRLLLGKLFASGAAVGGFLLIGQNDWSAGARFAVIGRMGQLVNRITPTVDASLPHWNVVRNLAATALALAVPFALLWLLDILRSRADRSRASALGEGAAAVAVLCVLVFSILMTESRTPWLLLPVVVALAGWWLMVMRFGRSARPLRTFWLGVGALAALAVLGLSVAAPLLRFLPGPDTFSGRRNMYAQSLYLAQDVPFTGAGLDAFPPYYSEYIRVVPVNAMLFEDTGNSAYQTAWVEQGVLGMLSLVLLSGVAAAASTRYLLHLRTENGRPHPFIIAGALALTYGIAQMLIHAMLVDARVSVFLLLPAGFALAGYPMRGRTRWFAGRRARVALAITGSVFLAIIVLQWSVVRAAWTTNRGVLEMAREQFVEWPEGRWSDGSEVERLAGAESRFQSALTLDPDNAVAHHRLGLINMLRRDHAAAVEHLEHIAQENPDHRGVRANLGFAYTWVGDYESALPLLQRTRNALRDLHTYAWWWESQGEDTLSQHAQNMAALLAEQP